MRLAEASDLASRNLVTTYLALGKAVPKTRHYSSSGFDALLGEFPHPICNFGISNFWTEPAVRNILGIHGLAQPFNLYVLPGERPFHLFLPWDDLMFQHTYSLKCMRMDPVLAPPAANMEEALECDGRSRIADFMSRLFFTYQSATARRGVAEATVRGENLRLFGLTQDEKLVGTVMISQTEGCLGLYNLCVEPSLRGKGIGTSIVNWVLARAATQGLSVTLQCDPKLEKWYEHLGFATYGSLEVYSFAKKMSPDIMLLPVNDA